MRQIRARFSIGRASVRARLMLWNICALAVILSLLGGIIQYTVRTNLLAAVDRHLAGIPMPRMPGPPPQPFPGGPMMFFPGRPGGPPLPSERRTASEESARSNYMPRMLPLEGSSAFPMPPRKPWDERAYRRAAKGEALYTTVVVEGSSVRVYSKPIREHGRIVAVTQVPYLLDGINQAIAVMNRALLTLIPVALALAGLGGAFLTGRALRPVRNIVQAAEHIGAQQLSRRLPVVGNDEFSHLAATFNRMLGRLEVAFAEREALVKRLEDLIEQERRFTADASHELKTPLTIIKANTSLLLQDTSADAALREALRDVDGAADAMSRLVHDLLLLARFDGGQLGQNRIPLPIGEVLERVKQRSARPNAAAICLDAADPSLMVLGNEDEIMRLLTNLLENAVRYTPPEGTIHITAREDGENVLVRIVDTGIGIAPEHLPHLGERFYRVDAARSRPDGGTGLGLSICKSIVEAHGGTMSIQSETGRGTTVCVRLPRASAQEETASPGE